MNITKKNHDFKCMGNDEIVVCIANYVKSKHGKYDGIVIERDYGIEDLFGDEKKVPVSGFVDKIFHEAIKEMARRKGDSESRIIGKLIILGFLRVKEKGWEKWD